MIRVRQVKVNVRVNNIKEELANKLKTNINNIIDFKIIKESIDSRNKPNIYYVYELDVNLKNEKFNFICYSGSGKTNKIRK